jgi:predicted NBD/HSP70 family sugar kinase
MNKLNSLKMKNINTNILLEKIIEHNEISRADLSRLSKLNKATVSSITQELIEKELVYETGDSKNTGGRKARLLKFNKDAGTVIAIDFGIDVIISTVTNLKGEIIYRKEYLNDSSDLDFELDKLNEIINHLLENSPESFYGTIGIGIAIHGLVNNDQTIEYVPYYEWTKLNLSKILEKEFDLPVFVDNDSNLFTLGEHILMHHNEHVLGVNISSGVGLGIIINKKEYKGANGYAGEIGHMIIEPNGRKCTCGNSGCLEQYASEQALVNQISIIKGKNITIDEFITMVQLKDDDALKLFKEFTQYMAIGINNIGNLFNPDVIVLNSDIFYKLPKSIALIKQQIKSRVFNVELITGSEYLRDSILLGASFTVTREFLGIKYLSFQDKYND